MDCVCHAVKLGVRGPNSQLQDNDQSRQVKQQTANSPPPLCFVQIVVACAHVEGERGTAPAELLLYPRYHLDNSSLLARFPLPTIPLALDAVGHHVLVACAPLDIMVLKVEVQVRVLNVFVPYHMLNQRRAV